MYFCNCNENISGMQKKIKLLLFIFSVVTVIPFLNLKLISFFDRYNFKTESSVWCLKTFNQSKLCKFKNVCYDSSHRGLLFFVGKGTVIKGIEHFTELQKLQLSSVNFHNQFYANLSIVDAENYKIKKEIEVESKVLLFSRFKPNNIMHSIHDDLFPIFLTLELVCGGERKCIEDYKLVFHDNYPEGPFFNLYKSFSKNPPILIGNLSDESNKIICFEKMLTGLIQDSIFYQYGFKGPHGPVKNFHFTQNDILRFTSFLKEKLKIKEDKHFRSDVLLVRREKNRKILNVDEVKQMVGDVYQRVENKEKTKFLELDLHSKGTINFIKAASQAKILIGMHGAEMIFSLFMKPNSVVIEIFPYGIQPDVVSFVKPVSQIEGSHFCYISWRNMYKNSSIVHSDTHPAFGGITHLDKATQEKIKNIFEVPPVKCCNNPAYLFYMYQDTWVSSNFKNFLYESISDCFNRRKHTKSTLEKWFYPYIVQNISCEFQAHNKLLLLNWSLPLNVKVNEKLTYSIYVTDKSNKFRWEFSTKALSARLNVFEVEDNVEFQVWISSHLDENGFKSPDAFFRC